MLNVTYEPLNVCNIKRAVALVLSGKAETLINGRGFIHSSSLELEIPSVIKLGYMVKRPRPRIALSKKEVFRRDNYTCQYCGKQTKIITLDHVIPRRAGGMHTWDNLTTACMSCNRRKGGKRPDEANMPLRRIPAEPRPTARYRFGRHLVRFQEWSPFIEGW